MREAIGGTWLFQIVIFFIILFTGFMCLSINRSKAFNVKNRIVETIQAYSGIDVNDSESPAMQEIVDYMKENAYRTTGTWPSVEILGGEYANYQCYDRNGKILSSSSKSAIFCISELPAGEKIKESGRMMDHMNELKDFVYYRVVVFYQLDLPIFHDLFNFQMVGDTKTIYHGGNNYRYNDIEVGVW